MIYLVSLLFDGASIALNQTPPWMIQSGAWLMSRIWYWCLPFRVDLIINNLKLAYGNELSEKEIHSLTKKNLIHYIYLLLEFIQFRKMPISRFKESVQIKNKDIIKEALKKKGVIVVTAHLGNFEWMALKSPFDELPLHMIVRPMKSPWLNQIVTEQRQRTGVELIGPKESKWQIFRLLQLNKIVAVIFDQRKGSDFINVNFFGQPARTTKGLAVLVERVDPIIVPVYCHRTDFGKMTVEILPPQEYKRVGTREENIYHNTQAFTDTVEMMVRRHPEQWFWIHNRWKQ